MLWNPGRRFNVVGVIILGEEETEKRDVRERVGAKVS
jgi:hypothetical protein